MGRYVFVFVDIVYTLINHRTRSHYTSARALIPLDKITHTSPSTRRGWPALVSADVSNSYVDDVFTF